MEDFEVRVTEPAAQESPAVTEEHPDGQTVEKATDAVARTVTADTAPQLSAAALDELPDGLVKVKVIDANEQDIWIDQEFRKKLRVQNEQERDIMERNLLRDRYMLLTVWHSEGHAFLLDGHSGLSVCLKHDIPVHIRTVALPDRQTALLWICENQGGRRNWSPEEFTYELGSVYNQTKQPHGGHRKRQDSSANNQHLKTADALAVKHGVAPATVRNAGNYAMAVDKIGDACGDEARQAVREGKAGLKQGEVVALVKDNLDSQALQKAVKMRLTAHHESNPLGHPEGKAKKENPPGMRKGRITKKQATGTSATSEDPVLVLRKLFELLGESPQALADRILEVLGKEKAKQLDQCLGKLLGRTETALAAEKAAGQSGPAEEAEETVEPKATGNRS